MNVPTGDLDRALGGREASVCLRPMSPGSLGGRVCVLLAYDCEQGLGLRAVRATVVGAVASFGAEKGQRGVGVCILSASVCAWGLGLRVGEPLVEGALQGTHGQDVTGREVGFASSLPLSVYDR